jgi:hypothetical protein
MQIPEFQSNKPDSVQSFSQFISGLNFHDFYEGEKKKSSFNKIVKAGEMNYKVIDDADILFKASGQSLSTLNQEKTGDFVDSSSSQALENTQNILHVQLSPLNIAPFIEQMPQHITTFINELAAVVKRIQNKSGEIDYRFHFKKLNLDISLSHKQGGLAIVIYFGNESFQDEFTNKKQEAMLLQLQTMLDQDNIELEFQFNAHDESQSKHSSSHDRDESQQESDDEND